MNQQHISDIAKLVFSRLYILIAGTALMVVLARLLTPEAFGQYQLVMSLVFIFSVFVDWGVSNSLPRYLAEFRGHDKTKVRSALLVGLCIKLLALILGGLILITIKEPLGAWFKLDSIEHLLPLGLLILVGLSLTEFLFKLSEGFQLFRIIPVATFIKNTGDLVLSLGLILLGYGVAGALLGKFAATLIAVVIGLTWLIRSAFLAYPATGTKSSALWRRILTYGSWLVVIDLADRVLLYSDRLLINYFLGAEMVGLYSVPARVAVLSQLVGLSVASVVGPAMGKDPEGSRQILKTGLRFLLAFYALCAVLILGLGDRIILVLFGDHYAGSIPILRVYAGILPLLGLSPVFSLVLNYRGAAKHRIIFIGLATSITVVGNLILIPWIGILGSAVAMGLGQLMYVVGQGLYCSRMESLESFWPALLGKVLLISLCSWFAIWMVRTITADSFLVWGVGGVVAIGNVAALFIWGVIRPYELLRLLPKWSTRSRG